MSHAKAYEAIKEKPKHYNVIFISNPDDPFYRTELKALLYEAKKSLMALFYDYEFERDEHGTAGPTKAEVQSIIDFAKDKDDIICCCHAGISRSSATAYVIGCIKGEPKEALKVLTWERHTPNALIVKHAAEILGKPEMVEVMEQWKLNGEIS